MGFKSHLGAVLGTSDGLARREGNTPGFPGPALAHYSHSKLRISPSKQGKGGGGKTIQQKGILESALRRKFPVH